MLTLLSGLPLNDEAQINEPRGTMWKKRLKMPKIYALLVSVCEIAFPSLA